MCGSLSVRPGALEFRWLRSSTRTATPRRSTTRSPATMMPFGPRLPRTWPPTRPISRLHRRTRVRSNHRSRPFGRPDTRHRERTEMAATIPAVLVRELREKTGVGFMECKAALTEANGDLDRAITLLREKGLASASKKMGRVASDGLVVSYVHGGGKIGVLLELNCETDFVARTDEFSTLARDIAMQGAAG